MIRWLALLTTFALGCATVPPPDVLSQLDRVRAAPAAAEAKAHAPDAVAEAEKLRAEARAAFEAEDAAGAQIIGEHAIAAYHEAVAIARAARAEAGRLAAKSEADATESRLSELEREHQEVASDISSLERRLEVLADLEVPPASGEATQAREQARREAVVSLQMQARLLCAAGDLLAATVAEKKTDFKPPPVLAEARAKLGALDALLEKGAAAAPIDEAMRARAACLEALTLVRRAENEQARASGRGDALLVELSKLGLGKASRDDRGVILTLRDLFANGKLSDDGKRSLAKITAVAAEHPDFPLLVVIHHAKRADEALGASRATALVARLRSELGDERVGEPQLAGTSAPVVDPAGAYAAQNERIDLVFVTPESL